MQRFTRANARRRISLLASSSLMGASVLAGLGTVAVATLAPSAAFAIADVICSPVASPGVIFTSTTEVCVGSGAGISFTNASPTGMYLLLDGATPGMNGVIVNASGGTFSTYVADHISPSTIASTTGNGFQITAAGGNTNVNFTYGSTVLSTVGNGVYLNNTGTGTITFKTNGDIQGARNGIYARTSGSRAIEIDSTATVTSLGAHDHGISAYTAGGPITVNANNVTSSGSAAIIVGAISGSANVTTTGAIKGGRGGIYARGGNVSVNTSGGALTANSGDGIYTYGSGAGVTTINSGDAITITAGFDGIHAIDSGVGTGGGAGVNDGIAITVTKDIGSKSAVLGGRGIFASISNGSNGDNVNINLGGNVYSQGTGVYAQTTGAGNIKIVTQPGANVNSTNGDGIDAFARGGGNVYVHLMDGAINSNTSGLGPLDPNGVFMTATKAGTVTIVQDSAINNKGPGDGIRAFTQNGADTVTVNAPITNTLGNGVNAKSTGSGQVTVNLGSNAKYVGSITTTDGAFNGTNNGVIAAQEGTGVGTAGATINSTAGGSVTITGNVKYTDGLYAETRNYSGKATIAMSGAAGGKVSVEGGYGSAGLLAVAHDGSFSGHAGSASITTNKGLTVSVNTLGGNNAYGVHARTYDVYGGHGASVTLGDSNTITVGGLNKLGAAVGTGDSGVSARANSTYMNGGGTTFFSFGNAKVAGGANEHVTVTGANSTGVYAQASAGTANISFGDGGAIAVVDPTKNASDTGVAAYSYIGAVTINLGTTSVSTDGGVGIYAGNHNILANTFATTTPVLVTSQGNINAGLDGIDALTGGGGNVTVNYGTRAGTSPTLTAGTAGTGTNVVGIKASSTGAVKNVVAVNVGNTGSGATTIHATNVGISVTGKGNFTAGTVTLGNNVTIDPDHYGIYVAVPGTATVTTGNNDTITVTADATKYNHHVGIFAESALSADGGGSPPGPSGPSVNIALGTNNTINVGDAPESLGIEGVNYSNGNATVSITAGNGLNIHSTGANSQGVSGYTYGSGNVTIGLGTGSITVAPGASGVDTVNDFGSSAGIRGESYTGGNVSITTAQSMDVSNFGAGKTFGIYGQAYFGGNVAITVNGSGTISSHNGAGVAAYSYNGNISIKQAGASTINSTNGDGIHAIVSGAGSIDIHQPNGRGTINATNGNGITAQITGGGSGNIYVGSVGSGINGFITAKAGTSSTGIGIDATTDGHGNVSTYSDTLILKSDGIGILAQNTGGKGFGDVTVDAENGSITTYGAGSQGIFATTNGNGTVKVTDSGNQSITTLGALADGIKASNTSGTDGGVGVYVTGNGTISATGNGIYATTNTKDGVTVTTAAHSLVNGRLDGILATITNGGSGALVVTANGNIGTAGLPTGITGISATSNSVGIVDVTQGAGSTIYSGADGIDAISNATALSGNVTVLQSGAIVAGGGGIFANVTNAANGADVNVTSHTITSGNSGVYAHTAGSGNVTVKATGVIKAATGFGIESLASGGNSTVTTLFGAPVTGGVGISSQTTGVGNSVVTVNDNVTGTTGDAIQSFNRGGINFVSVRGSSTITGAGDGINASVTYGLLTVNTGVGTDIETTTTNAKADGVHAVASAAGGTVTLNLLGTIGAVAEVGGDGVYASTVNTALTVNVVNGIQASGTGVFATSYSGDVTVTTATGTLVHGDLDGIRASSTGTDSNNVTITANGNIGTAGDPVGKDGLSASAAGSGSVTVNQGAASKIYAGGNGILAVNTYSTGSSGPVTVNQLGSINSGGAGINARVTSAGNLAAINVTSNKITSGGAGVSAQTAGIGAVTVNTTGTIVAGGPGVLVGAAGGLATVNVGGATTGSVGVSVTNSGSGGINITDTGFAVKGTTGDGIFASSTGTGVINVGTAGTPFKGAIYGQTNGVEAAGGSTVNVFTVGNITAVTGETVLASSTGGPVNVYTTGGTQTGATGISAISGGSGASGATCVHNTDTINTTGARGIDAESKGGNVCVYSNANITATKTAIYASTTGAGTVTIGSAANPITGVFNGMKGAGSAGIQANDQAGAISITTAADMTALNGAAFGIEATSTTGGITISNTGGIGSAGGGVNVAGISAISSGANSAGIFIFNKGNIFVNGGTGSAGIFARNAGTGTVGLINSGAIDPAAYGMHAQSGGAVVVINSGPITAGVGIFAKTTGAATKDTVTVINSGTINATTDAGIHASGVNGTVYVTSTAPIVAVRDGIVAFASGRGAIVVNASATNSGGQATAINAGGDGIEAIGSGTGSVTVTTSGNVTSANEAGIFASSYGSGSVTVTTNNQAVPVGTTNAVVGYSAGIVALSYGETSTTVTANTTVSATGTGTFTYGGYTVAGGVGIAAASGSGGVTVNANGNVYGVGVGIGTFSTGNGTINIANGVTVSNRGGTTNPVVEVVTGTGSGAFTTTINNAGTISSNGAAPSNQGDLAIRAIGGNVTVNNAGTIDGTVDFSLLGSGFASVTNNTGTWNTTGVSTFGSSANTINNSGTLNTRGTTTFNGQIAFNNSGLISLGGPRSGGRLSNGLTNDVLLATGTTLNGLAGSTVALDADLSFTPQTSCTALSGAADCLALKASTGTTGLLVTDTGAHALGAFNPGIAVVTGSSGATTFTLDPRSSYYNSHLFGGVLDKPGFFFYDLVYNAGTEYLVSAPKPSAVSFSAVGGALTDVWYATTQTWFDRQADLRDEVDGRPEGAAPAVWLKAFGDWNRRSGAQSFTTQGHTYTYDTSYNQDTAGLIGGVDALRVTGHDTAFVLGLQGGYVSSDVRFRSSLDTVRMTGSVVGAYATYLAGPLFVDATFNSNFLNIGVGLPDTGPGGTVFQTSGRVRSLGGQIESGYALPIGSNAFVEPLGLLAYEQTHFDDLIIPGGTEHLNDTTSFRGALGGRVGVNLPMEYYKVKLAVVGRLWDEFNGDSSNTLFSAGPNVDFTNRIRGVFGEVQAEANVFEDQSGFSAFLNGGIKFKTRYQEETATLGFRYDW